MREQYGVKELEIILDRCPGLAWIKNRENQIIYVNQSYANTFKMERSSIIGKREETICGGTLETGHVMIRGKSHYFEVKEKEMFENGEVVCKMGVAHNVTMEQKLQSTVEALLVEHLTQIQPLQEEDLMAMTKALEIWERYLFTSMPAVGKMIFLCSNNEELLDIGLKKGICSQWDDEGNQACIKAYAKESLRDAQKCGKTIETTMLSEGDYSRLLKKIGIQSTIEFPIPFGDKIVGMIYMYFDSHEQIGAHGGTEYMRQTTKNLGILIKNTLISKQVEKEMKKNQSAQLKLRYFFELTTDYIAVIKEDSWRITKLSKSWTNEIQDQMNSGWAQNKEKFIEAFKKAKKYREFVNEEAKYLDEQNEMRIVWWQIRYIPEERHFVVWGQDVTARKKFENQKNSIEAEVEKEKINTSLLKRMSNGFKHPIEQIQSSVGELQLIEGEESVRYIVMIKENAQRLEKLIADLLANTQEKYEVNKVNREVCDLVQVVKNVIASMATYVETNQKQIIFQSEQVTMLYGADVEKVEHMLINLISNALKYTQPEDKIVVYLSQNQDELKLHVMDNGEGIPKKRLPSLFNRFSQEDRRVKKKKEGSGIGLSHVKHLMHLHNGQIEARSQWGVGTEIILRFPRSVDREREEKAINQVQDNTLSEIYYKVYGG